MFKTFKNLKYSEINKSKIKLIKPYRQFEKSQIKVSADEEYKILKFSRVCFDEKRENGIVVVEYLVQRVAETFVVLRESRGWQRRSTLFIHFQIRP